MILKNKIIIAFLWVGLSSQSIVSASVFEHIVRVATEHKSLSAFLAAGAAITALSYYHTQARKPGKQLEHFYKSKESQELIKEPVEWPVRAVYNDNPLSRVLAWAGGYVGKYVTRYAGNVANSKDPATVKAKIDHYQSFYKDMLNMHEFHVPQNGFKTFNDWFTRRFERISKARPMSANALDIVSPADSKLLIISDISADTQMTIKEQRFDIARFLNDKKLAKKFEGGTMMIFRLAPYDYHRYHYPFDCTVQGAEVQINGTYHSVNPRAFNVGCKPLTENKRSYEILKPAHSCASYCLNDVAMVQVGATAVASIVNNCMDYEQDCLYPWAEDGYEKGEEMGRFQFGGSTLVLLFPLGAIVPDATIVENSRQGYETAVKVRETVATWKTPAQALREIGR